MTRVPSLCLLLSGSADFIGCEQIKDSNHILGSSSMSQQNCQSKVVVRPTLEEDPYVTNTTSTDHLGPKETPMAPNIASLKHPPSWDLKSLQRIDH